MCASSDPLPGPYDGSGSGPGRRTLVLGVGNSMAGDDGFGPEVLAALEGCGLPPGVELADGGVLGVGLLAEIEDFERLILVDAVRPSTAGREEANGERGLEEGPGRCRHWVLRPDPVPGCVVVFRLGEDGLDDPDPRFSLHDLSFGGTLRLARVLGLRLPEIWVVGYLLSPLSSLDGPGLSPGARRAVAAGATAVRGLLARN
jgi:Ni,Fe-hydrogenase maturation factor